MALAAIDPLVSREIQLLADCFGPVFVIEIPIVAHALIVRRLLRSFPAVHSNRTCFLLAATETGRSCVETWIEQHEKAKRKAKHRKAA
jgi:hypothetical protein